MMHQTCAFARKHSRATLSALVLTLTIGCAVLLTAQLPVPASTQFDITGFIQAATVSGTDAHAGGTITVNNHQIVIPKETIVILPANALTWSELFLQAPTPWGPTQSGLADADTPRPVYTYEAHVIGNRVIDATRGDQYIAGLVYISQQSLNSGAGFINFIDYSTGEMRVGGAIGSSTSGTRVQLNDPNGRYGRKMSPDPRFTVDPDNPTISAATGFPMCVPRTDPSQPGGDDPLCPQGNRPITAQGPPVVFQTSIQMTDPTQGKAFPDPTAQAPMEIGDYVTYAGTMFRDTNGTFVSAHTITNNVAIYTWPGTSPAYILTDTALIGTGGLTILGGGEAAIRTRFEGMSTDPSRNVHLYGIDLDPTTGATTDRDWGTIGVDPGPPTGALKGRWRFRPPCTATTATQKACTPPVGGTFLPPTREVRAVIEGLQSQVTALNAQDQTKTAANGLFFGQYHAPILEYIFPENVPGAPVVENNFNAMDFLARGGYTSSAGTIAKVLDPWPSNVIPAGGCTAAVASAGGPYTAPSGGNVTLAGAATGSAPITYLWSAPAGQGTFSDPTVANPVFTAPATGPVTLTLTASNCGGSSTANATVTVNAPAAPTVNTIAPQTFTSGSQGNIIAVSGTDPQNLALTFTAAQDPSTPTPALGLSVTSTGTSTANVLVNVPVLPAGQVTPSTVTLNVTASNGSTSSAPQPVTVTINPQADVVAVQSTEYRTSKQRLIINASSSVVNPGVILKLQPYLTVNGTIYNPDPAVGGVGNTFTNNGGGLYLLDMVGAPEPAVPPALPIVVKSSMGGTSIPTGITKLRQ